MSTRRLHGVLRCGHLQAKAAQNVARSCQDCKHMTQQPASAGRAMQTTGPDGMRAAQSGVKAANTSEMMSLLTSKPPGSASRRQGHGGVLTSLRCLQLP